MVAGTPSGSGPYTFNVVCNDGTNATVSVADVHGGTSAPVTGVHFGANCTVVEAVTTAGIEVSYDPVGVNTTGMVVLRDDQVTVTVTNSFVLVQPKLTG